jgi:subtilisin family serine protease
MIVCGSVLSGILSDRLYGQEHNRLWLHLNSKAEILADASPDDLGISHRALWRRSKVLPANRLLDVHDLPVDDTILQQIRSTGARVRSVSRWLNAISVEATPAQAAALASLSSVGRISEVAVFHKRVEDPVSIQPAPPLGKRTSVTTLDYGSSYTQLDLVKVVPLHTAAISGNGVIVGMVDDGYNNHRLHEATSANTVLAEYDFIQGDTTTSVEPGEYSGQGNHGMYTYSALSGFKEGSLVGPAYGSSYLLAKTEIITSETQVEEDLYVQGLEWLEQQGADIVSSSLGYIDWYTYADLDGNTTVTTKAARIATRKGVLLVTAMGNEGWYQAGNSGPTGTMITPADADSVISVGAVSSSAALASFSSTGPTFDGRFKPEVVAQGISVVCANPSSTGGYVAVNGTSLSTPLTAGVAALVLSAHPYLTPAEVREAIITTAVRVNDGTPRTSSYPNNFYGYGLVNAFEAVLYHGPAFSNVPAVVDRGSMLDVYSSILSKTSLEPDSLFLYYQAEPGGGFQQVRMNATAIPNQYVGTIPKSSQQTFPRGYVSAHSVTAGTRTSPYNAPDSLFEFISTGSSGPGGLVPVSFQLYANYPNPFNAGTTVSFDAPNAAQVELTVVTLLGQRVATIFDGNAVQGRNMVYWDARDGAGARVPSGVYFYRLSTPQGSQAKRMMILK